MLPEEMTIMGTEKNSRIMCEALRAHCNGALKLMKTVAEFTLRLSGIYEQMHSSLQTLVESYRKKNDEISKDKEVPNLLLQMWEAVLTDIETTAEERLDLANVVVRTVANPLTDFITHKTSICKKLASYQEEYDNQVEKIDKVLHKLQKDYGETWLRVKTKDGAVKNHYVLMFTNTHNDYILQLAAINKHNEELKNTVLPKLSADHEDLYAEILRTFCRVTATYSKTTQSKLQPMSQRQDEIAILCKAVDPRVEIVEVNKALAKKVTAPTHEIKQYEYIPPDPHETVTYMKNRLVVNKVTEPVLQKKHDELKNEILELEVLLEHTRNKLDGLKVEHNSQKTSRRLSVIRMTDTQDDLYKLRNDARTATCQLSVCKTQLNLFPNDWGGGGEDTQQEGEKVEKRRQIERRLSAADLNTSEITSSRLSLIAKSNPVLAKVKGKLGLGKDKAEKAPILKRQTSFTTATSVKGPEKKKILRRQRSLSELEQQKKIGGYSTVKEALMLGSHIDPIYEAIKEASSMSALERAEKSEKGSQSGSPKMRKVNILDPSEYLNGEDERDEWNATEIDHSPRRKSSESHEMQAMPEETATAAPEKNQATGMSGSQKRRVTLQSGRSVSLETEASHKSSLQPPTGYKSHTRGSYVSRRSFRSHCTSISEEDELPGGREPKHRVMGDIYAALFNFEGTRRDDLSLRAGDKLEVLDRKSDWWKGKMGSRIGYFPSFCVVAIQPWERVLKVTRTFSANSEDQLSLRKDQIVIQISSDENGWIKVKTGYERGLFPYRFLQSISSGNSRDLQESQDNKQNSVT